jgi:hypothetical protein
MDASDPITPQNLLCHGGRPHMGPGLRRDDKRYLGKIKLSSISRKLM